MTFWPHSSVPSSSLLSLWEFTKYWEACCPHLEGTQQAGALLRSKGGRGAVGLPSVWYQAGAKRLLAGKTTVLRNHANILQEHFKWQNPVDSFAERLRPDLSLVTLFPHANAVRTGGSLCYWPELFPIPAAGREMHLAQGEYLEVRDFSHVAPRRVRVYQVFACLFVGTKKKNKTQNQKQKATCIYSMII